MAAASLRGSIAVVALATFGVLVAWALQDREASAGDTSGVVRAMQNRNVSGDDASSSTTNRVVAEDQIPPALVSAAEPDAEPAPPRSGSEDAAYYKLIGLFRTDRKAFDETVRRFLQGPSTLAERVAALRATYDSSDTTPLDAFLLALEPKQRDDGLGDFALRYLGKKARREVRARDALARYLRTDPSPRRRAQAIFPLLRWGTNNEIHGLRGRFYAEQNPGVIGSAAAALADSDAQSARRILEDLQRTHPVAKVREQIETVLKDRTKR